MFSALGAELRGCLAEMAPEVEALRVQNAWLHQQLEVQTKRIAELQAAGFGRDVFPHVLEPNAATSSSFVPKSIFCSVQQASDVAAMTPDRQSAAQ